MRIDLHGVKHADVEKLLEDTLLTEEPPFRIVTGNSYKMKEIVKQFLEKHEYEYSDFGTSIITQ